MPQFIDNGVKCGNCKQYHESAAHVKACYMEAKAQQDAIDKENNQPRATEKQESFLRKLVAERDHGWSDPEAVITGTLTSRKATSAMIDTLLGMPKAQAPVLTAVELEDGIYKVPDGQIFKVYHTVHGANQQVAKVLHVEMTGTDKDGKCLYSGEWEYLGKKPLRFIKPEYRLTQEQAKQFGLVYSFCCNCTRDLTREESIHVGYGPTCAKNNGWWYPTKVELKALKLGTVSPEGLQAVQEQVAEAEVEALADYCNEPF